jgi:FixJ family two-component response regulator
MSDSARNIRTVPTATVYIVDDDAAIRRLVAAELRHAGYRVAAFESAADFLKSIDAESHGCLLLDIQMPGMSGVELQTHLGGQNVHLPIVFLSGAADVPLTATVMKRGAVDLIQKEPWAPATLLEAVRLAMNASHAAMSQREKVAEIRRRIAVLTPREREIAGLLAQGIANKQIAATLGLSKRTVEIHRGRVMFKMQADNLANFVLQWTAAMG